MNNNNPLKVGSIVTNNLGEAWIIQRTIRDGIKVKRYLAKEIDKQGKLSFVWKVDENSAVRLVSKRAAQTLLRNLRLKHPKSLEVPSMYHPRTLMEFSVQPVTVQEIVQTTMIVYLKKET